MTVSVVVCAYNEEKYIARCMRSLQSQVFDEPFEIVLVDDASTDKTVEAARSVGLSNLRIISLDKNVGIGAAARRGVQEARGRYVVRVDADDYVSKYFLQILLVALAERSHAAVRCDYFMVDEFGTPFSDQDASRAPIACGILFERDALVSIGLYREDLRLGEDSELESRFGRQYEIAHVPIPLYRYRIHDGNSSNANSR